MSTSRRIAAVLAFVLVLAACGERPPPGVPVCPGVPMTEDVLAPPELDLEAAEPTASNVRAWIERLADSGLGGRRAGEAGSRATAALLARQMDVLGLEAPYPDGVFCQGFEVLGGAEHNVIGHLRAPGARRVVVVGAHYDGQGKTPAGAVLPSADDNASGVAALFEVARLAARREWPFELVFIAFGGEETGRIGSHTWADAPTVDLERLELMVNLDMVSRPGPEEAPSAIGFLAPDPGDAPARRALAEASRVSGVEVRDLEERFNPSFLISDDTVFRPLAPAVQLSTGRHSDYHQPTDTADRADVGQTVRAARLVLELLGELGRNNP